MPISALPFAPQLKLHLDKMTAFENGAEWHPPLSAPHLFSLGSHHPLNLKRSGTIIPVGARTLVATPGLCPYYRPESRTLGTLEMSGLRRWGEVSTRERESERSE